MTKGIVESESLHSFPSDVDWQSPVEPGQSLFYDESECSEDGRVDVFNSASYEDSPILVPHHLLGGSEAYHTAIESMD
jgi:hypothetical protein